MNRIQQKKSTETQRARQLPTHWTRGSTCLVERNKRKWRLHLVAVVYRSATYTHYLKPMVYELDFPLRTQLCVSVYIDARTRTLTHIHTHLDDGPARHLYWCEEKFAPSRVSEFPHKFPAADRGYECSESASAPRNCAYFRVYKKKQQTLNSSQRLLEDMPTQLTYIPPHRTRAFPSTLRACLFVGRFATMSAKCRSNVNGTDVRWC